MLLVDDDDDDDDRCGGREQQRKETLSLFIFSVEERSAWSVVSFFFLFCFVVVC